MPELVGLVKRLNSPLSATQPQGLEGPHPLRAAERHILARDARSDRNRSPTRKTGLPFRSTQGVYPV